MGYNVYTSLKSNFLEFHEYVNQHGTIEEQTVHGLGDITSAEYIALYKKWVIEEQIQTHKFVDDDGEEFFFPSPYGEIPRQI